MPAVPVDAKNKRMMKEVVTEEPSSAAVSQQQRRTMPMNFFPHQPQPHLQQLRQSPFSFNFSSQQQQRPTDQPENLDRFLTRPFTSYTALLTEEDDCVPGPLRRMYDHIDQITKSHVRKRPLHSFLLSSSCLLILVNMFIHCRVEK